MILMGANAMQKASALQTEEDIRLLPSLQLAALRLLFTQLTASTNRRQAVVEVEAAGRLEGLRRFYRQAGRPGEACER